MSGPDEPNAPPNVAIPQREGISLPEILDKPLALCRAKVAAFKKHPTPAWAKRNVHGQPEPVTNLDIELQGILTAELEAEFPSLPVIGEEGQSHLPSLPGDCLLIDPIDGTAPLLNGEPWYAITVALIRDSRVQQAVIDLPAFALRVSISDGTLDVRGNIQRLPIFTDTTVLTSPRHVERLALAFADHGLTRLRPLAVPTATCKMLLVALQRAPAALYLPQRDSAVAWDYAAATLALNGTGAIIRDDIGRDLASAIPDSVHGWATSYRGTHPVFDVLANAKPQENE